MASEVVVAKLLGIKLSCVSDLPAPGRRIVEWRLGCGRWYLTVGRVVEVRDAPPAAATGDQEIMMRIVGVNGGCPFPAVVHDDVWVCVVRHAETGEPRVAVVVGHEQRKAVVMLDRQEHAVVLANAIGEAMDGVYPPDYKTDEWQWN